MTPQDVITAARVAVQDTRTNFYRYTDADMLTFVNQSLTRMAVLRPDLFSVIKEWPLTPETVLQTCPTDSHRLVEIFCVVGANAVVVDDVPDFSLAVGAPARVVREFSPPARAVS